MPGGFVKRNQSKKSIFNSDKESKESVLLSDLKPERTKDDDVHSQRFTETYRLE